MFKITAIVSLTACLMAVTLASAASSVTATDGGTAAYGNCNGFAIDFDATPAAEAVWTPPLVSGQAYVLNSIAIKNSTGNSGSYYLGIYTGFAGGILSGFKGVSDAANNFSASANDWLTFTFSNLNYDITVDSTVGSGSGLLYFVYQPGASALTSPNVTLATDKFGADTYMTDSLAGIIAYGGIVADRSPQYQATITPVIPTKPPMVPIGLNATGSNAAVLLDWSPSSGASGYNVKRSIASGDELTVTNVTGTNIVDAGLVNGTLYYYVISASNSIGESANSSEVSATPMPPPAPPTGLSAAASDTTVSLTWAPSDRATSYNLKRSLTSGGGYQFITNVVGTNAMDAGLDYGSTYYYVVASLNSDGEGANSGDVSATTKELPGLLAVTNSLGVSAEIGSNGVYQINFASPEWTFLGAVSNIADEAADSGTDAIGGYAEITFQYKGAVLHTAGIRLYNNSPVVTFNDATLAAGANDFDFPHWTHFPMGLSHLSFIDTFSVYSFKKLYEPWTTCDNLLLYFATNHDAFLLSAATNYTISSMWTNGDGSISCGVNSGITQLPSGFAHRFILVAQNGINRIYTTWGGALMALAHKTPPPNDAAIELNKIGYWTDNGSAYHYTFDSNTIASTLISVNQEYLSKGISLGYMQLDSWWYEKGSCECWYDNFGADGTYLWIPDPTLFPNGLAAFQQQLGLPLFLHNRWIYSGSPYASTYQMSGNVCIDPAFWTNIMAYAKSVGACTYEQDWLNDNGIPNMNLNDPAAYLNNMAMAAAAYGINLQYCMDQGRDYLQASLYTNVMTTRDCPDIFNTNNWTAFLYGAPVTHALGVWAWSDVYESSATRNLLISTLSAGPVGAGDPLGSANAANLLKSVRPDGVIVKPDVPLAPVDDAYVNDSLGQNRPMVATTYTDQTNSRTLYVFAYGESPANLQSSFRPADSGITNNAYIYNYFAATGTVLNAGGTFNFTTTMPDDTNGGTYFIVAPIGPSGMAFLGDTNKFVTRGKKRISRFSDTGLMRATASFAAGETNVTLTGYAPSVPYVFALAGSTNHLIYDSSSHLFALNVSPDGSETAAVAFSLAPLPSLTIAPGPMGQFQISWPANAAGYVLEETTSLVPPVQWSQALETVDSIAGRNLVTITNGNSAEFYRLRQ